MTTHKQAGFTLIELMVTMMIMFLLISIGLASFISFNNRQKLVNSAHDLQLLMRTAQKQARVGSKPAGCTGRLLDYQVEVVAGSLNSAQLNAHCQPDGGALQTISALQNVDFAQGVQTTGPIDLKFQVLHGGVSGVGAGSFDLVRGSLTGTITVTDGGDVSEVTLH